MAPSSSFDSRNYGPPTQREKDENEANHLFHQQALAEGSIEVIPSSYLSAPDVTAPALETGIAKDERYWDFFGSLRAQGSTSDEAHLRAANRAKQEAWMRAKGDASFSIENLARKKFSAKQFARKKPVNDNEEPPKIRATPFVLVNPATLPSREWLLGKFALRKEISVTVAPGGLGKTTLSHVEGVALASGKNLLDLDVPNPLRVWIWNGEEPLEEMDRRIGAICLHYGITRSDLADRLFLDTEDEMKLVLCVQDRNKAEVKVPVIEALVAELKEREIDYMVVDPFVSTHNCTENDNNAMHEAASAWKTVAKQANCAIHLVHHTRKSGGQIITAESLRGGDAVASKARAVRPLNPLSAKDAKRRNIPLHEAASIFFYDPAGNKVNMTRRGGDCEWYKMVSVSLGNRKNDEIGVVTRWTPPPEVPTMGLAESDLATFKIELAAGFYLCAFQSQNNPTWVGHLIARCFHISIDAEGGWKRRSNAIWKQLVEEDEVIESQEHDERHQPRKVGRPAPAVEEQIGWTPPEDISD